MKPLAFAAERRYRLEYEREHADLATVNTLDPSVLIRDDDVMGNRNCRVSMLDAALRVDARRCPVKLYRTMHAGEVSEQGGTFVTDAYGSFSEIIRVALDNATERDDVMILTHGVGVCYYEWLKDHRDDFVKAGVDEAAVDNRIARATMEKEWVIGHGIKMTTVAQREGSGQLAGHQVLVAKPAVEKNTVAEVLEGIRDVDRAEDQTQPGEERAGTSSVHDYLTSRGFERLHTSAPRPNEDGEGYHVIHHYVKPYDQRDRNVLNRAAKNGKISDHSVRFGYIGANAKVKTPGAYSTFVTHKATARMGPDGREDTSMTKRHTETANASPGMHKTLIGMGMRSSLGASGMGGKPVYKPVSPTPAKPFHEALKSGGYSENKGKARQLGGKSLQRTYSHPTDGTMQVHYNLHPQTAKIAGVSHVTPLKGHKATASEENAMTRRNEETAVGRDLDGRPMRVNKADSLLLNGGTDVMRRYDSMMTRRKTAALCDQPRVAQRLDKQINILRAALGMEALPAIEVRTSGMAFNQNLKQNEPSDPWNRDWMKSCTASCLRTWANGLRDRGFAVARTVRDDVATWTATGSEAGTGPVTYELAILANAWCVEATRNGRSLGLFGDAQRTGGGGAVLAMAGEEWDGTVDGRTAQAYATAWSRLIRGDHA